MCLWLCPAQPDKPQTRGACHFPLSPVTGSLSWAPEPPESVRAESQSCPDQGASANLEVARGFSRASRGDLRVAGPCGSPEPGELSQTLGPCAAFPSPFRAHLACRNVAPGPPAAPGSCRLRAAASMAAPLGLAVREERRLRGRRGAPGRGGAEEGGGKREERAGGGTGRGWRVGRDLGSEGKGGW